MRALILSLIASAMLLIAGCGGGGGGSSGGSSSPEPLSNTTADGGGDGNNGGGGGNGNGSNGDGGGERPSLPAEVELSISPFIEGLRIQWHNLSAIEGAGGIYIHLNLTDNTTSSQPIREKIVIEDLTDNSYEIDGLDNGTAYRLVGVRVEQANNTFWVIDNITWSEPWQAKTNALDNNGGGIVVGANHDGDGRADGVDEDDDNDGRPNSMDDCRLGEIDWLSTNRILDYDSDGCRDRDEDWDNDNDGVNNTRADGTTVWDLCSAREMGELHWQSNSTSDHDRDGCRDEGEDRDDDNDGVDDSEDACPVGQSNWNNDGTNDFDGDGCRNDEDPDSDNDGILNADEEAGCELTVDCDGDGILDIDEIIGCASKSDCDNDNQPDSIDIDDEGDGLIEIRTAEELDAVRWVLNGTGYKVNERAVLNQTGCGNGRDITACNGYELVNDISLSDYIATNYSIVGWLPIAHDVDTMDDGCQGSAFTGIFDGNGFAVHGLFINRSEEDCIGLFGRASGIIRHLGVIADRVIGEDYVGGLLGQSTSRIVQSYGLNGKVSGSSFVGGFIGSYASGKIIQSYVVNGEVSSEVSSEVGSGRNIGGLLGNCASGEVIQSYAVSDKVSGSDVIGGLIGTAPACTVIQSYASSNKVGVVGNVGGLVGDGQLTSIIQSYVVSGEVRGSGRVGGLIGNPNKVSSSYWDIETSGRTNDGATGSSGQTTEALRSPTDYTDIYATWDDGVMVDGINVNTTIWCDEDASGMIEDDERRGDGDTNGDNRVWDFGTSTDYPALRCTSDSLADQRAWWHLNATHKPQLNQTRLDGYLDGSLP